MAVGRVLELWPQLMGAGTRLGSPAPASGAATPGSWLGRFMSGASARAYRVGFIASHWYGSDFSGDAVRPLGSYLKESYARYHKGGPEVLSSRPPRPEPD